MRGTAIAPRTPEARRDRPHRRSHVRLPCDLVNVGVALLALAGVAALMGKKQIEQAVPPAPAPEQAIGSVKRDVATVKRKARR